MYKIVLIFWKSNILVHFKIDLKIVKKKYLLVKPFGKDLYQTTTVISNQYNFLCFMFWLLKINHMKLIDIFIFSSVIDVIRSLANSYFL